MNFCWNRTDDLGINSPVLWLTKLVLYRLGCQYIYTLRDDIYRHAYISSTQLRPHNYTTCLYNAIHQNTLHFFKIYYYLQIKLLFWEEKSTIGSYIRKKILFELWSNQFVSAFSFLDETFCLKLTKQCVTGSHFAITFWFASWRGIGYTGDWLCLVLGAEWSTCRRVVNYHTGAIRRQSTGAQQPPCARCFSQVGWFRCAHPTWPGQIFHRAVPSFDTSLRSARSCPWGSWWFWTRFWALPTQLLGFRLRGTLSPPQTHPRASASWAVYYHWESPLRKFTSRGYKKPFAPNSNPGITFNTVSVPINQTGMLVSHSFHGDWYCGLTSLRIIFWIIIFGFIYRCFSHVCRGHIVDHRLTSIRLLEFGKFQ